MFFKKNEEKSDKAFDYGEKKEAMLLNMVTDTGLALTPEEKERFEKSGWIDTGKFNGHGQPLVKNVKTGEVLSVCRSYPVMSITCNPHDSCNPHDPCDPYGLSGIYNNPCGIAH